MVVPAGLQLKITVDIKPEARRDLEDAPHILAEELCHGLERSLLIVESEIKKQITTIHLIDTGRLRSSIYGNVVSVDQHGFRGEVSTGTNVTYARIHEFGGVIVPVNARVLAWVDKGVTRPAPGDKEGWRFLRSTGAAHIARKVTIRAKYYMRDGLANAAGRVKQQIQVSVTRAWARVLHGLAIGGDRGGDE